MGLGLLCCGCVLVFVIWYMSCFSFCGLLWVLFLFVFNCFDYVLLVWIWIRCVCEMPLLLLLYDCFWSLRLMSVDYLFWFCLLVFVGAVLYFACLFCLFVVCVFDSDWLVWFYLVNLSFGFSFGFCGWGLWVNVLLVCCWVMCFVTWIRFDFKFIFRFVFGVYICLGDCNCCTEWYDLLYDCYVCIF